MATNTNSVFQKIFQDAEKAGIVLNNSKQSLEWLRRKYSTIKPSDVTEKKFTADVDRRRRVPLVGRLYMFLYNPKYKVELPYYDRFPLVYPFQRVKGGFYGLNIHYLPPMLRVRLMDSLYDVISNSKMDETTRLKINYQILDGASKYRWFKPCVKHYLTSHMQSSLIYIEPIEWNLAIFLPTEQFQKSRKQNVWKDSRSMVI